MFNGGCLPKVWGSRGEREDVAGGGGVVGAAPGDGVIVEQETEGGEGEGGEHGGCGDGEGDDRGDGGEEDGDEEDGGLYSEFGLLVRINVDERITRRVGGKLPPGRHLIRNFV